MIYIDFRTHVIEWKKTFHLSVGRKLTTDEWTIIRSIPKQSRFNNGEEMGDGKFFGAYSKSCINGIIFTTPQQAQRIAIKRKQYLERTFLIRSIKDRAKYKINKAKKLKQCSEYFAKNKDVIRERRREYNRIHLTKEKRNEYARTMRLKRKSIPCQHIAYKLRNRLRSALRSKVLYSRGSDAESIKFLIWLAKYQNIDHRDGYDIDHIIPLSKHDLSTDILQKQANSPSNIRWMKHVDNMNRRNKLPTQEEIDKHMKLVSLWKNQVN